jgi:hypothetical protein
LRQVFQLPNAVASPSRQNLSSALIHFLPDRATRIGVKAGFSGSNFTRVPINCPATSAYQASPRNIFPGDGDKITEMA